MKKGVIVTLVAFFIIVLLLQLLSIGLKIAEFVNPNEVLSEELRITKEEIAIQNGKFTRYDKTSIWEYQYIEEELRITKEEIYNYTYRRIEKLVLYRE